MQNLFRMFLCMVLFLLLSSCSIIRLTYDNGPRLAWWWIDSYLDFTPQQAPQVKQTLRDWFNWHRTSQLPKYAHWLTTIQNRLDDPLTPTQVCRESDKLKKMLAPTLEKVVQLSAPLALQLTKPQLQHLAQHYTESNAELRRDFLQTDLEERKKASIERAVKRIENVYGSIDTRQHAFVATSVDNSPFNPEIWMVERERQQQAVLQTLHALTDEPASIEQAAIALKKLIENMQYSDNLDYRAYQQSLTESTCHFIAHMHNITTPSQRQHAREIFKDWEDALRILMTDKSGNSD